MNLHLKAAELGEELSYRAGVEVSKMLKNPHAQALGKLGGKVKSEAKAAAARKNGKKGGRPRKRK